MIQIPEQVKDAPIVRMKNAVLVGTMKFTLDRFDASFDAEENPASHRAWHRVTLLGTAEENSRGHPREVRANGQNQSPKSGKEEKILSFSLRFQNYSLSLQTALGKEP